ncbi:RHS repeat-associated core domain-containing protein, partial [Enterobacter asburiae]
GQLMEALEGNTVIQQTWRPSGAVRQTLQQTADGSQLKTLAVRSLAGLLQQVTGVDGNTRVYTRETKGPGAGRINQVSDGKSLSVTMRYDALHRVSGWTATELKGGHTLAVDITPDEYGRESVRTLTHSNGEVRTLTQTWYTGGQLKTRTLSRSLNHGQAETLRAETFSYDARSRLKEYQVTGSQLPRDAHGNAIVRQHFTFDALSNIRTCETTLDSAGHGDVITATFGYAEHDPCRLRSVTYDKTQYGHRNLAFSDADYDAAGRLLKDEAGRRLHYDVSGRLVRVDAPGGQAVAGYGYDAGNRLAWQRVDATQQLHRLYYRGSRLVNEWVSPQGQVQNAEKDTLVRLTGVSQSVSAGGNESTLLLGTDAKGSLLTGYDGSTRDYAYGPHGQESRTERASEKQAESVQGWNGERKDPVTGVTHLGNGYRAYNPVLMRFHCPDSLSPFGAGGLNAYAYCAGDPVNHSDPTGHLSWGGWLSIGLGILSVVVGVATLGLGAAGCIALGVMAASMAVLDVASGALAIASGALEEKDPALSEKLGWASVGVGLPSAVYGGVKLVQGGVSLLKNVNSLYEAGVGTMLRAVHEGEAAGVGRTAASGMRAAAVLGARVGVTVASQTSDASAKNTITWGRNIRTPLILDDETNIYIFTDTYRGGYTRVNVVAHGDINEITGIATVHLSGQYEGEYTGSALASLLEEKFDVDFRTFTYARTIVCGSANGEHLSFAQGFALGSGLRTKGFFNSVTTESHLETLIDFWSMMNKCDPVNFDLQTLHKSLRELKDMPDKDIFRIKKVGVNWQPRPFDPPLLEWEQPYSLKSSNQLY